MANFEGFTSHLELKEKVLEKMTISLVKFKKNTGKALKLEWDFIKLLLHPGLSVWLIDFCQWTDYSRKLTPHSMLSKHI